MQCVPWLCRSCTGSPTKLCVTIVRPLKSGCPRSMPVSSTATLMPAPLRRLAGTLHSIRPHVAPETSRIFFGRDVGLFELAQVLRDRLRGPNESRAATGLLASDAFANTKYSGSMASIALSSAISACALMPRAANAPPEITAAPISGNTSASASPTASSVTACFFEIAGIGDTQPLAAERSPRLRGRVRLVGDDVAPGLQALVHRAAAPPSTARRPTRRGDARRHASTGSPSSWP